ncbi:MAG: endonuclease/exonuclease/phosphatase family protein [Bacteroidota bacterium]
MNKGILVGLFCGLLLFISLTGNAKPANEPTSPETDTSLLKVLSWNIYMLPAPFLITGKRKRAKALGNVLDNSDYDVLLFQEAFHHGARRRMIKRLKTEFPFRHGPALKKGFSFKINSGLWVFSKQELKELGVIKFKDKHGLDNRMSRKGALLLEGSKNGNKYQVLVTHLNSGGPFEIRQGQLDQIKSELLEPYAEEGVAQILCGDFNISKFNEANYSAMLSTLNAEDGELAEEGMSTFTYDGVNNRLSRSSTNQGIIDFIFLKTNNSGATIVKRLVPEIVFDWSKKTNFLSDHHPVEAVIRLGN